MNYPALLRRMLPLDWQLVRAGLLLVLVSVFVAVPVIPAAAAQLRVEEKHFSVEKLPPPFELCNDWTVAFDPKWGAPADV